MSKSDIIVLLVIGIILSKLIIGFLIWYLIKKNKQLQKEKELLAIKNKELSVAEEFKMKILSMATHDLRSPFVAMRMLMETHQLRQLPPHNLEEFIRDLEKQIIISQKVVDDILLWTAGQIKNVHQVKQIFNISQVIDQTVTLFHPQIKRKEITIKHHIPETIECNGNLDIFNFVARNILHNAINYSPLRSEISIDLDINHTDNTAQLSFKDKGIGMDSAIVTSINSGQFFPDSKTKESGGMGLGLSLCYMLAKQADWKMKAESSVGQGSIISVYFPVLSHTQNKPEETPREIMEK